MKAALDLTLFLGGITALTYAALRLFYLDGPFAVAVYTYAVTATARKLL